MDFPSTLKPECSICLMAYTTEDPPLILSCGHSFCRSCLKGLSENNPNMTCPMKCPFQWVPIDVVRLPENLALLEGDRLCGFCSFPYGDERKPLVIARCGHSICSICSKLHSKELQGHLVMTCPIDQMMKAGSVTSDILIENRDLLDAISRFNSERKCCDEQPETSRMLNLTYLEQVCPNCIPNNSKQLEFVKFHMFEDYLSIAEKDQKSFETLFKESKQKLDIKELQEVASSLSVLKNQIINSLTSIYSKTSSLIKAIEQEEKDVFRSISTFQSHKIQSTLDKIEEKLHYCKNLPKNSIKRLQFYSATNQSFEHYRSLIADSLRCINDDKVDMGLVKKFEEVRACFKDIKSKLNSFSIKSKIFKKLKRRQISRLSKLKEKFKQSRTVLKYDYNQFAHVKIEEDNTMIEIIPTTSYRK